MAADTPFVSYPEYGMGTNSMTEGQKSGLIYGAQSAPSQKQRAAQTVPLTWLESRTNPCVDSAGSLFFFFALFIAGYLLE